MRDRLRFALAAALLAALCASPAFAVERASAAEAILVAVTGDVRIGGAAAELATPVPAGTEIRTGPGAEATLLLPDGSTVTLRENARFRVTTLLLASGVREVGLDLDEGGVFSEVIPTPGVRSDFSVRTPVAVAGVRGTSFLTEHGPEGTTVDVFRGVVEVRSPSGAFRAMRLAGGERAVAGSRGGIRREAARRPPPFVTRPEVFPPMRPPEGFSPASIPRALIQPEVHEGLGRMPRHPPDRRMILRFWETR